MHTQWIICLLSIFIFNSTYCQVDVSNFKYTSDKYLESKFNSKSFYQCRFLGFYTTSSNKLKEKYDSSELVNNNIDSFMSITFRYSIFSKALNFNIEFDLTLDKNLIIIDSTDLLHLVPDCVRLDLPCNLISKDKAIRIAIKDKILYNVDFRVELYKDKENSDFYWIITGYPNKIEKTTSTSKSNLSTKRRSMSIQQKRIINAKTGLCTNPVTDKGNR